MSDDDNDDCDDDDCDDDCDADCDDDDDDVHVRSPFLVFYSNVAFLIPSLLS